MHWFPLRACTAVAAAGTIRLSAGEVLISPCLQVDSLQAQLAAACDRAEKAERQQHAAVAASTVALNRAQQELQDARSAQYVAEEAHKTADAAARLLAQKITGERRL